MGRDAQALVAACADRRITGGLTAIQPSGPAQTFCQSCGKPVSPRIIFLIQTGDGGQRMLPALRFDGD